MLQSFLSEQEGAGATADFASAFFRSVADQRVNGMLPKQICHRGAVLADGSHDQHAVF